MKTEYFDHNPSDDSVVLLLDPNQGKLAHPYFVNKTARESQAFIIGQDLTNSLPAWQFVTSTHLVYPYIDPGLIAAYYLGDRGVDTSQIKELSRSVSVNDNDAKRIITSTETSSSVEIASISELQEIAENLSDELANIRSAILDSQWILDLQENWDDEGSIGYEVETLAAAGHFLSDYAGKIFNSEKIVLDAPNLYPGPDGSIDVHWANHRYGFLVNISPAPSERIGFFGKTDSGRDFKGSLDRGEILSAMILFLLEKD
ncbi:MAG: hypothetical protein IIA59_12120 [Candidatus Marinimicrobia bacterium]|nr:hypothetical protein [Candidatus Neomarinimicrobiota bacterium]